ncbi:hypothetical protein [Vibrio algarum]|uniref:Uncharacterized protein n=1 Tax=Vibrio algarum TaxID=3020714 RepID=A0ABT4YRS6_9VIBR|nr:hypothetical protein [Vibrio sp. KJ40-1]MDB1124257.1 hypothetical protein [Vibrio sp. KJ40-1]
MSNDFSEALDAEVSSKVSDGKVTESSRSKRFMSNVGMVIFGLLFYGGLAWKFWLYDDSLHIEKAEVKASIVEMVNNGSDLESIKHFYSQTPEEEWGFKYRWDKDKSQYYPAPTPLLTVLKDLKSDSYLNPEGGSKNRESIQKLLTEYQERNPFDGLEQSQKDSFESIRIKLGSEFANVSSDFYKISENLKQKNLLVDQYLSDSRTSLYLSIASLLFAFLTTLGSQYFYWKKKKKVMALNFT